jgi:uncharacterized RDD family membrane protein YckC
MSSVAVNTSLNVNIDFDLAGVDRRLFAWLVDFAIRLSYLWVGAELFTPGSASDTVRLFFMLALILPIMFYFLLFELLMNGQSPGKKLFKLKVISLNGYKPTYIQYLNRWIFRLIDTGFITIFFFGFINDWIYGTIFLAANFVSLVYIMASDKSQRIGDLIANTVVIRLRSVTRIKDTIFTEIEERIIK